MPRKYHIEAHETPHRFPAIGRSGIIDWGEGCLKCAQCVKYECVYGVYGKRTFSADIFGDTIDEYCKDCFRCVQGCPKRLIHKTINPEWEQLGDDIYTPTVISATWEQAKTGKIPVSGSGYGGMFSGPGFDSMWTDMSEIVRPTRDGIHGREYISTVVDLGRRPARLRFDTHGKLLNETIPFVRLPLPILFDMPPFGRISPAVGRAMAVAASKIGTRMLVPYSKMNLFGDYPSGVVPVLDGSDVDGQWLSLFDMVQVPYSDDVMDVIGSLKQRKPDQVIAVRLPAARAEIPLILDLARNGAEVIHCLADQRGFEPDAPDGVHLKDFLREAHAKLMELGIRDEVTLVAGGGIAMAEHVIKAMLCGANLVSIDIPLLIALECRVCRNCVENGPCPVRMSEVEPGRGAQRIVNLMAAWHNQLLEIMGAMGIREARRLRGEQGRVMFFENLEAETFGRLFGNRKSW